ncbi:MAG: FliH/SctL family protein [Chloroflexota bacterium]
MLGNVIKAVKVHVQTAPLRLKAPARQARAAAPDDNASPAMAALQAASPSSAMVDDESASALSPDEQALVETARGEADRIMLTANHQAAEVLRAAQSHGFEAGRAESHAANESEVKATLIAAQHIFEESRLWRAEMLTRSEASVIGLVKEVAEKLFGEGFELPPEQLQQVVNRALEQARNLGNPRVRLHPQDATLLKSLCPPDLVLVPDETIKRGGCQIEAERGAVDSRIETQLNEISKTLDRS